MDVDRAGFRRRPDNMMTVRARFASAAFAGALAFTAGCGSTVQYRGGASAGDLSGPASGLQTSGLSPSSSAGGVSSGQAGGGFGGTAPVPGEAVGSTGTAAGQSARGPITIGVLTSTNTAAQEALGVNPPSSSFDSTAAAKALIGYYNAHGGVAGRRLEAVYKSFGADDPSYQTDMQAACATFTQDNHVAAVFEMAGAWDENFQRCLTTARAPYIGGAPYDDQDLRAFPGAVNPNDLSLDDRVKAVIETLSRSGYLSKANLLGVVLEDCPDTQRVLQRSLLPTARSHGFRVAQPFAFGCVTGFASAGPGAGQLQQAVLQFKSAGVDRVMFISHYESAAILLFARDAENAVYRPGYALSSNGDPGAYAGGTEIPAAQQQNFHGAGWQPFEDVRSVTPVSTAARRCLQMFASQGLRPANSTDNFTMYIACDEFFLFESVLSITHGVLGWNAWLSAVESLGREYPSTFSLGGASYLARGHHYGAGRVAAFAFQTSCSCMRYEGSGWQFP